MPKRTLAPMCHPATVVQGYVARGDIKIELFADKSAGIAYLERDPTEDRATTPRLASGKGGKFKRKGSLQLTSLKEGWANLAQSTKAAKEAISTVAEGAPPTVGADRQLVLYTWLHTEMDPGSADVVNLPASELDKGMKVSWVSQSIASHCEPAGSSQRVSRTHACMCT